ncbi:MAG: hypothetical protein OXC82_13770 [Rhodobacteraceae bacterium]|nr:hypothetical protein [Paracoccaceae bacterium]
MNQSFLKMAYEDKNDGCITLMGLECTDTKDFNSFLNSNVRNRLYDIELADEFIEHINGIPTAKMESEVLADILNPHQQEKSKSDACEALAEAFLEMHDQVVFPWNMQRDKRNPRASLPGPDVIGIVEAGSESRFAFGEVKGCSHEQFPPSVMYGIDGMEGQLRKLINNQVIRRGLILWLFSKVKGNSHLDRFLEALKAYIISEYKNYVLFGVLLRDTRPTQKDLSNTATQLTNNLSLPTKCNLTALYLPWPLDDLISRINASGTI